MPRPARRTVWLSSLLTAAAVTCVAVQPAVAAPQQPAVPAQVTADRPLTESEAIAKARTTGAPVPVEGATTPTDTLTANPDGSLTLTTAAQPVRKHVGTAWVGLDPTLHANADGTVAPAVTTSPVSFSGGGTAPIASLRSNGAGLQLTAPMTLPKPTLSGNRATYTGVLPDVDLVVTADTQGGFSQVFVVHTAAAATNPQLQTLTMATQATGATISADGNGNLTAADPHGRPVFAAPTPTMWDSSGAPAKALRVSVDGGELSLSPDAAMMQASGTKFPVFIDPTWTPVNQGKSAWATITKNFPSTFYYNKTPDPNGRMQVGNSGSGGIWSHTLLNFSIPSALAGATINEAKLTATEEWSYSCSARYVDVYAPSTTLSSSNAKWDSWSGVSLGSAVDSQNVAHGYNSSCPAASVGFNVLSTVQADVSGGKGTQTFVLTGRNEATDVNAYKEFNASSPQLSITYNHAPSKPVGLFTSPSTDCMASNPTIVGDADVSLFAPVRDPDGGQLSVAIDVWKTGTSPHQVVKSTGTNPLTPASGSNANLIVDENTLKTNSPGGVTQFSWQVKANDGIADSPLSDVCTFAFDPTRPGAPTVKVPNGGTQGQNVSVSVTPGPGTLPTAYTYQLNGRPPVTVAASNIDGGATFSIKPNRFANTIAVTAMSAGGNFGDTGSRPFTAVTAAVQGDHDLDGDGRPDLLAVGGANGLPAGLWQARGTAGVHLNAAMTDAGVNGTGVVPNHLATNLTAPTQYTGSQVITGHFTGGSQQDILVYYPGGDQIGTAVIITGSGDGSALQLENGASVLSAGTITDTAGVAPAQLVNAGNAASSGFLYPDLLGVTADGSALNYFPNSNGTGGYAMTYGLSRATPDGSAWGGWTLASNQSSSGATNLLLWKKSTGALYLWTGITVDYGAGTLAFAQQYSLGIWNAAKTLTLQLQLQDVNGDGTPDVRTVEDTRTGRTYPITISGGTATISTTPAADSLLAVSHDWPLNEGTGEVTDMAGSLTGTGAAWHRGDLFSPDLALDGTGGVVTIAAPGGAVDPASSFSISAWVKPADYRGTVFAQNGTSNATVRLYADRGTHHWSMAMSSSTTTAAYDTVSSADAIQLGVWVHLTGVFDVATHKMSLYIGAASTPPIAHTTTVATTGGVSIGDTQAGGLRDDVFNGQISSVQTYAVALSHADAVTLSGDGDNILMQSEDLVYPSGTTLRTRAGTLTFSNGLLTVTETGTGVLAKTYGTAGYPGAVLTMQYDGNLVIYPTAAKTAGSALWASATSGSHGNVFVLQTDGNFVCYTPANGVCWSSGTANAGDPPAPTYPRTGGPAVYTPLRGRVEIYYRSTGNALAQGWSSLGTQTGSATGGPTGTVTDGTPVAIYNPVNNATEVYYNSSGHLTESYQSADGIWHNIGTIGGSSMSGSPAVLFNPVNNAMEVYYNDGGQLREVWWTQATAWTALALGGTITGSPSAMFNAFNNHAEVYFNSGGTLSEQYWVQGTGWTAVSLGAAMGGSPSALFNPTNNNGEVYYATSAGQLTQKYWNASTSWSAPQSLGATVSQGAPAAYYDPAAHAVEVYCNSGGNLTEKYTSTSGWQGPTNLGGTSANDHMAGGAMPVYNFVSGRTEVYLSTSGTLAKYTNSGSGWSTLTSMGGTVL
ncbi:LamG-like jellyroll fold domain-containing protein [Dactylosporangium sp. NPDC000244]|uniref:LamG-like jellyroll fold domain-containing protein n=1 Tax=Dactylosporangium sp. NPDC000244 TaxID=3154365 RepID=UPI0033178B5D